MQAVRRYKQLKSLLNMEMEVDKEIRTDLESKIAKNTLRICENKQQQS